MEIAEGIADAWEMDRKAMAGIEGVEGRCLPDDASESERMLLRAYLLGHDFVDIVAARDGGVRSHVAFDRGAEPRDHNLRPFDRYDLRGCESAADVFDLTHV